MYPEADLPAVPGDVEEHETACELVRVGSGDRKNRQVAAIEADANVAVEVIARESVGLLDAGGLRALTVRALTVRAATARLGVAPASLYSRVQGVEDLFDLALDQALCDDESVQEALRESNIHDLMLALRRHLLEHPWACQVIGLVKPLGVV
ncbi:CbbQ/NirQ/NorQ C-terminal domain-containing protein [Tomitella gaofuii]|uniref:CbbQ/NirQ/NorQ domain-containing protein n=1 Tax=Tomitella gaofuii TaxID=2760083 RepID=UPI0039A45A93